MVTNWPSRLSQKSMPNASGRRRSLTSSMRLTLFGTDKNPSAPLSRAENCCVGGLLSLPRMMGVTVWFEDNTVMLVGDSISVKWRSSGAVEERNSATIPLNEIKSPTWTWARTDAVEENTIKPLETRLSELGSPTSQKPLGPYTFS